MTRQRLFFVLLLIIGLNGCYTIKRSDYEKKVRAYIELFAKNLSATDQIIKAQFDLSTMSNVSMEGIMEAVQVMQNRDQATDSLTCSIDFKDILVVFEDVAIRVELRAQFTSLGTPADFFVKNSAFTLWLTSDNGDLSITNIKADDFYNDYRMAVHEWRNTKHRARDLASRKLFFDQARTLQQTYDTVIWYAKWQDSVYYYVANSEWSNYFIGDGQIRVDSVKMGLVSETGRVIVPPEYDQVGTIGFELPDVVEVRKDNHVGHFTMDGKEIIPATYDWIIPFDATETYALVKQDTTYGWIDTSYAYHTGFPSTEAERYIFDFGYLDKKIVINNTMSTAEIVHPEHMGSGLVVPPTYFVQANVFDEIITNLFTGENALGWGGTESVETRGSLFEKVSEKFSALLVMLNDDYLEGREGFYERTNLTFVDDKRQPIGNYTLPSGALTFNRLDSTIMEVRISRPPHEGQRYDETDEDEWYVPFYQYFSLSNGTISKFESNRYYKFTEFVKMDSSYLEGKFIVWGENETLTELTIAPDYLLVEMRNEILASYGYDFAEEKVKKSFGYRNGYKPLYQKYEDFYDQMTDIDRHNLEFLEKMIGTLRDVSA